LAGIAALKARNKTASGTIEVTAVHKKIKAVADKMRASVLDKTALKQLAKEKKLAAKQNKKNNKEKKLSPAKDNKVYLLEFTGDVKATAISHLRQSITAILSVAGKGDEVVVNLESPGGFVHSYGLAASQLSRIKNAGLTLTICVDKVAASGGYMMACVADKIISAPFAVVGSIGVVAQIPNFHKLLKKNDVDVELLTAGDYKRTLTMFGENTDKDREKFIDKLENTHGLFKNFIRQNRASLDVDAVADGDVWYGIDALEKNLVDAIQTSDEYLLDLANHEREIYKVKYTMPKSFMEKLTSASKNSLISALEEVLHKKHSFY